MRHRVVTLRFAPNLGAFDDRPLTEFARDKDVLSLREHFFSVGDLPHLACLLTYDDREPPAREGAPSAEAPRTSPTPLHGDVGAAVADLSADDRSLFGRLREWRTTRSRKEGVPPYVLFTNRELLAIVRERPASAHALQSIDGIGPGKVERYGEALLGLLGRIPSPTSSPIPTSAAPPSSPASPSPASPP